MSNERDYGTLYPNNGSAVPSGTPVSSVKRSQIYLVTHDGNENRLPYMNRSFISFTFGGKHIEDFNLIATFSSEGMDQNAYADFEDITSENKVVDGQLYWRTRVAARELTFDLATDSLTQPQLDDFLQWFAPGQIRQLVLAEHPNRAIYARVGKPPQLKLTPYESTVEVVLGGNTYTTSTTVYKGTITLELVMDDPYWFALLNIFGYVSESGGTRIYRDVWTNANDIEVDAMSDKDALKIAIEDGIPFSTMIQDTMHFGNNVVADMNTDTGGKIAPDDLEDADPNDLPDVDDENWCYRIALMDEVTDAYICGALISGPFITTVDSRHFTLNSGDSLFFYYPGTAKSLPTLSFTLTPRVTTHYISNIRNKFITATEPYYNVITLESTHKAEFKFTTPGVFTAYNQAIYILSHISSGDSWEAVRARIRDEVKHYYVRAWANVVINYADKVVNQTPQNASNLTTHMELFLKDQEETPAFNSARFVFNSKTGEAKGTFKYRTVNPSANPPAGEEYWRTFGTIAESEENVGDMTKSSYLVISDRNYPNNTGHIVQWSQSQPANSYKLYHNVQGGLADISLDYKNMYW